MLSLLEAAAHLLNIEARIPRRLVMIDDMP